jgi:hypothetical protein
MIFSKKACPVLVPDNARAGAFSFFSGKNESIYGINWDRMLKVGNHHSSTIFVCLGFCNRVIISS